MRSSLLRAAGGIVLLAALLSPLPSAAATAHSVVAATGAATNFAGVLPHAAAAPAAELGYDRLTIRRGGTWYLQPDLDGGPATSYAQGPADWIPVAGDTDGDGDGTLSLFRDGIWLIHDRSGGPATLIHFGSKGDIPVMGDWNGDGVDSLGVFRNGRWYLRDNSALGPTRSFAYGTAGDRPVVGDWDGNGRSDIGIVRGITWFQRDAASAGPSARHFRFGNPGDQPVVGDWDHDGRDSPGMFHNGTWFFRQSNTTTASSSTTFGRAGDIPLIRRTRGLAPGVTHRVVHAAAGPFTEHIATVDLSAASSPDAVLAGGRLRGLEPTSAMGARSGAVLAINGDYFLSSGRPVHAFAEDGRLVQTPQLLGRAFGLDATGTHVTMGFPDTGARLTTQSGAAVTVSIPRWNSGRADAGAVAAFTGAGSGLEAPPSGDCYAGLAAKSRPVVHPDGGVDTVMTLVSPPRCGGAAAGPSGSGVLLDGSPGSSSGSFLRSLRAGQSAQLTESLGFPGAVDVLGGNPLLIADGAEQYQDLSGSDAFFDRQPRTAVGVTADDRLLLVVVDGRQPGYSVGMTLRELADLMKSLGAQNAINLDGGGSTTMWVNGMVANRPSDGHQRGVGSALVVLPGSDPQQADLTVAPPGGSSSNPPPPSGQLLPTPPLVSPVTGGEPVAGWWAAAADPGSVGGLAAAMADKDVPLSPDLQRALAVFDSTH